MVSRWRGTERTTMSKCKGVVSGFVWPPLTQESPVAVALLDPFGGVRLIFFIRKREREGGVDRAADASPLG
jgi:hypothetical protein